MTTATNTVAFSGGTEAITYRFSLADLNSIGILPGTRYNRKTANVNLSGRLSKRLSFEALAQYNLEVGRNRPSAGDALASGLAAASWLLAAISALGILLALVAIRRHKAAVGTAGDAAASAAAHLHTIPTTASGSGS